MIVLFRVLARLPLWMLHAAGAMLGWLAYLLSPVYRERLMSHARQAGFGAAVARGSVAHAGRMVAELPRLWLGAPVPVHWQGEAVAAAAYARGRGVLYLTPHLGCFEITAQALAGRFSAAYGALTVLYRPARQPWLAELVANARNRPGLQAVPTTVSGVRQMIRALRQGQAVGLLPDQVPPQGMGVWTPFFGRPAYTMTLAARLALQTGATLVLTWGERLPGGAGYRVHFEAMDEDLPADLESATAVINRAVERTIARCPQQYLWGYGRYKTPRAEPHGSGH